MAYAYETLNEKTISGALALLMHLMFFALLVIGVSWQKRETPPLVAELWSNLPAPKTAPPPPLKVEPTPVPKAEPKPPPSPKVEPKPEPKPVPKADIAAQERKEKERKSKEQELAEKKKKEEQTRLAALKKQKEREADEQIAREQDEALKKIEQAAAQARLVDEYKRRIADHIRRKINIDPATLQGNPEVEFDVVVIPGGEVLNVKLRRTSGQATWDAAVERAIHLAGPLPMPSDPALFTHFRELNLKFRPKE